MISDTFVEDFLMTYIVFLPVQKLSLLLINYYRMLDYKDFSTESSLNNKRKVVAFVKEWCNTAKDAFYEDINITQFLQVQAL